MMGGLLMGIFGVPIAIVMGVYLAIISTIIIIIVFTIVSYLLDALSIIEYRNKLGDKYNFISWIPLYQKYLLGKLADNKMLGTIVSLLKLVLYICIGYIYYSYLYKINSKFLIIPTCIVFIIIAINFILETIIAHKIYEKYSNADTALTIATVVTLGILRPIFTFVLRKKDCKKEIIV